MKTSLNGPLLQQMKLFKAGLNQLWKASSAAKYKKVNKQIQKHFQITKLLLVFLG